MDSNPYKAPQSSEPGQGGSYWKSLPRVARIGGYTAFGIWILGGAVLHGLLALGQFPLTQGPAIAFMVAWGLAGASIGAVWFALTYAAVSARRRDFERARSIIKAEWEARRQQASRD